VIFWKQECPKKGHASICIVRDCTPKNTKSFFMKIRMPQKRTIVICQNVNNIWQIYWNYSNIC
jgi:hypothetical protein